MNVSEVFKAIKELVAKAADQDAALACKQLLKAVSHMETMPDTITATELKWDCGVSLLIEPDGTYAVCEPNANPRKYSRTIPGDAIAKHALDAVGFYERRRRRRERRGRQR